MKTFPLLAFVVLALCPPALADAPQPPRSETMKVRISLKEGSGAREFTVMIPSDGPCATAMQKAPDREFNFSACPRDARLLLEWHVRNASGEYRSSSSIPFEHGSAADLGSASGPRLTVTVE